VLHFNITKSKTGAFCWTRSMCKIGYIEILVLVLSSSLIPTSHGRIGYNRNCVVNSTTHVEKYERIFVFVGEYKVFITQRQPWPDTYIEFHKLAGRTTRSQVIREGRKALDYFKIRYGIDVSHLITDGQIYNGVAVPFGDFTFIMTTVNFREG
ncbi:unnamed protein product, partial [Owenia fusiformis]